VSSAIKSKIPFLFLVGISIGWGFYYQSNSSLNDYGAANFEWLYLLDALVTLPLLCFLCIKSKKEALIKACVLSCIAIVVGSFIVPESSKIVWHYFEHARYLVLAIMLLFEVLAITTVYLAIKSSVNQQLDPDLSIERPIVRYLGQSPVAKLLCFETRMWTFTLFKKRIKPHCFSGEQHFTYHLKDGAQSNLLGFILLIAFEMPLLHLLLHFIWSPFAANVITLLTLMSLVFFYAEYNAVSRRPISLDSEYLYLRYGLFQPQIIPLSNIANIQTNSEFIKRSKYLKRYNYSGNPNVLIELVTPISGAKTIAIGVDNAPDFIAALKAVIKNS
jgi:hypothetical protein